MSFSVEAQNRLANLFIESVERKLPDIGLLLRSKHRIVNAKSDDDIQSATADKRHRLVDHQLRSLCSGLSETTRITFAEMDAKLVTVMWKARKFSGVALLNAVDESVQIGDRFSEVISRFCRLNLSDTVVQQLLPYAFVWPSLTTHPTNPTSVQFTRAGLALDRLLAHPLSSTESLAAALDTIRDTSMEFDPSVKDPSVKLYRKDPDLESDELLLILNVIYESVYQPRTRLRSALDRYGYKKVEMPKAMIDVNVWGAGDGDGNPNVTAKVLEEMVLKFRSAIRTNYTKDLSVILAELNALEPVRNDAQDETTFAARKDTVRQRVQQFAQQIASPTDGFCTDEEISRSATSLYEIFASSGIVTPQYMGTAGISTLFQELVVKVDTFGLRFTGVDVRHNSVDIMECYWTIHAFITKTSRDTYQQLTVEDQVKILRKMLLNEEFLQAAKDLPADVVSLEKCLGSDVAARVFSRLRVVAKYPGMFRKLIIAETRSAANAIAAMLLLKMSGNLVGETGASIAIVPLFESREDLIAAPRTVHILATDPSFLKHLEVMGYFLLMIAKSDTTRLAGPGVTGCQETTISQLLSMDTRSYGNKFKINIFIGGGDDQMRGGGRIVEIPHCVMLGANRLGATSASRVAMTIQGLQMQILFGSSFLTSHFIEAFAAQQLLAAARVLGHHPYRSVPKYCNRLAAEHDARAFFDHCMNMYEIIAGKPNGTVEQKNRRSTIVSYFSYFPMSVIGSANKSSRPLSRKVNPDPLEGRAISLDQLSKHDGAYLTSTLGVAKALSHMNGLIRNGGPEPQQAGLSEVPMSPIRHTFLANKTFRDFVRMQAVVLWQKDFAAAWALRGGNLPNQNVFLWRRNTCSCRKRRAVVLLPLDNFSPASSSTTTWKLRYWSRP